MKGEAEHTIKHTVKQVTERTIKHEGFFFGNMSRIKNKWQKNEEQKTKFTQNLGRVGNHKQNPHQNRNQNQTVKPNQDFSFQKEWT